MISDSANGSICGVCSEGTLSAAVTAAICGIREDPHLAGKPAAERIHRLARPQNRADRQQILDDIGRADAGQRPMPVVARRRRGDLDDRFGCGELEFAGRGLEACGRAGLPDLGQRRFECARGLGRAVAARAIARPAAARRGGSGPARIGKLPSTRNGSSGRNNRRAGSSVRGCASSSSSVPRTTLRNCSSTKVATAVSSPRSMARSNSRISSACDCGGSWAR